jgi:hypothetical protein
VGAGLIGLYLGLVALAIIRVRGGKGIERLAARLPRAAGGWLVRTVDQLATGLRAVARPRTLLPTVLLVALFWVVALTGWHLRLQAFGLTDTFAAAPFVVLVVGLGISVPTAPSYVGVMHACIVFALAALAVDQDRSFPFAVFLHAVDFAFVGILGVAMMGLKSVSLARLRAAARPDEKDA